MNASHRLLIGASLSTLALAGPAAAQGSVAPPPAAATPIADPTPATPGEAPDDTNPGEVVVTARIRSERLRDVPVAATAVDAQLIADQGGLRGMKDVLNNAPSVHFLDTSAPISSEASIRGSSTSRGTSADTTVGLYRDGMFVPGGSLGGRSFTPMDLFDVQRIEVLRGPQGALYGRNAVGGAINVVTNKPGFETGGSVSATYARFDRVEGEAIVNLPVDDVLSFRFGAAYTNQRKGYVYNPTRDEYLDNEKYFGLKGQMRLRLSERTNFNLSVDHFKWEAPPLLLVVNIPVGRNANYPNGIFQDRRRIGHNGIDNADQQLNTMVATLDQDLGWAKLTSITSYRYRYNTNDFDTDAIDVALREQVRLGGGNVNALNPNNQTYSESFTKRFTQEARLTGEIGAFKWLVGGDFTTLHDRRTTLEDRERQPPPPTNPPAVVDNLIKLRNNSKSWSAYGSVGYDFTPRFAVTAEARFTRDFKDFDTTNRNLTTGALVTTQSFAAKSRSQDFAYTLAANYKLGEWLTYARVGTAYRPGGFNGNLGAVGAPNPVIAPYQNEDSRTWEVGAKGPVIPGVFVTGAAYITVTDNALVQQSNGCAVGGACNSAATFFLVNSGKSRIYGFEGDINVRQRVAGGRFALTLGGSYQRGKFLEGPDVGEELARVPHWLFTGNVNYRHPLAGALDGFVNVKFNGTHGGVQDVVNPPDLLFRLSNYQVVDVRVGVGGKTFEVAAFARNAFNVDPVVFEAVSTVRYLTPRTYGVQVSHRF